MDRPVTYYGALVRALDVLTLGQNAMVGVAKIAEAVLGAGTSVDGFTCNPTAPASLSVSIGAGQVYQVANLENSTLSLLPQDTHSIVKQGLLLDALSLTLTPPTTPGYSQYVLVQTQYTDSDSVPLVLNYYNAANPSVPLSGPGGNGVSQSTVRKGVAQVTTKYGIAATAGSQVAPTPDAGWAPLFLITLSYGQTAITAGNIAIAANAPFIGTKLPAIPAFVKAGQVQQVVTSTTIYVRPDGSDANDGSSNDPTHAFATIAAAIATGGKRYALSGGSSLTIQLGIPGTYAAPGELPGLGGTLVIRGDTSNQGNYIVSGSGPGGGGSSIIVARSGFYQFQGVTINNTGTINHSITAVTGASVALQNVTLGSVANNGFAFLQTGSGGSITINSGCIVTGGMGYFILAVAGYIAIAPVTITIQNTPTFSVATAASISCGNISFQSGGLFSGSANGPRYLASKNGVIDSGGGGVNFIPGSSAGATNTGGVFV